MFEICLQFYLFYFFHLFIVPLFFLLERILLTFQFNLNIGILAVSPSSLCVCACIWEKEREIAPRIEMYIHNTFYRVPVEPILYKLP